MNILIKNGLIVDGTGSLGYKSDLLIKEEQIEKIGSNLGTENCEVIDASNKVVAPGFIDMHSHADLTLLEVNKAEAAIMQGVTTLVVGMCGIGLAPANDKIREYYAYFAANLIASSDLRLYDTLKDYMDILEKKGISTNLAFFIPHGNVRASVLGMEDRSANLEELEVMKKIVRKGMEDGAFGLSTGLIYPPGIITPTEELIELARVVSEYNGIYNSHMRNEGIGVIDIGMSELIEIAKKAKIQAQISHWKAGSNFAWELTSDMISLIKKARDEEKLNIHADMYPYEESFTTLTGILLRPWVYNNFIENLTNPHTRKKIYEEIIEMLISMFLSNLPLVLKKVPKENLISLILDYLKRNVRIISVKNNKQIEGKYLGDALKTLYPKKEISEAILNLIRDEEGSLMISIKQMNERRSILQLIKQKFVCIGSDGFLVPEGNTHPRSYGTFPRVLSRYVREKKLFSLEEGIRKMTSLPASILHLKDRGIIKPKYKADLVIFNPKEIKDKSTYQNGRQYPEGVFYIIVNGKITVANKKHLGVLNGQILKHRKNI